MVVMKVILYFVKKVDYNSGCPAIIFFMKKHSPNLILKAFEVLKKGYLGVTGEPQLTYYRLF